MMTGEYNMEMTVKMGGQIFENLHKDIKPGWAGLVLSSFDNYIKNIPTSVLNLYPIIDGKSRWPEAHEQFTKIRVFGLENKNYEPENYLLLAELVAKVTFNASGQPAPFDSDSGHHVTSLALKVA